MPQGNSKAWRLQGWGAQKTWAAATKPMAQHTKGPRSGPGWVGEGRTQDWASCQGGLQAAMGVVAPPVDLRVTLP